MRTRLTPFASALTATVLTVSASMAFAGGRDDASDFCMDVNLGPFHMVPGFTTDPGACGVQEYWDGWLQKKFYPFTIEDHQFNCEVFGDLTPLPSGDQVPSSVMSEGEITGTIGGHPFRGVLLCASQTNWYSHFCEDPSDENKPCFGLAQPFFNLIDRDPYPRVTEVSLFDGVITVQKNKHKTEQVPILMATRAAGITHLESLDPPQVGASITHSLLGLVTYDDDVEMAAEDDEDGRDQDIRVMKGSADLLLQGHIFFPASVEDDPSAAVIRGSICSKDLHKRLNRHQERRHRD